MPREAPTTRATFLAGAIVMNQCQVDESRWSNESSGKMRDSYVVIYVPQPLNLGSEETELGSARLKTSACAYGTEEYH